MSSFESSSPNAPNAPNARSNIRSNVSQRLLDLDGYENDKGLTPTTSTRYSLKGDTPKLPQSLRETKDEERKYLPKEWSDTKRMNVLFCEFRPKSANPEGWDSKMKF